MAKETTSKGFLPWPWDIVVYILAAIVLGFFISFLVSIPLVILFARYQRKRHPGMPHGGYCLARARGQLKLLPLGLLFLLLGVALLVGTWLDASQEVASSQLARIFILVVGVLLTLFSLFICFTAFRDSFFPEKSVLADSIRSQLPFPEEAPPVTELFAMVDKDLQENGITFGPIMIGNEWVLGDHASYIPRIRGVFGRDEIVMHHHGDKTTSSREVELYIVDDRDQLLFSDVKDPNELPMIMDCLKLRAPYAYFGDYQELNSFRSVSEEVKAERERRYRRYQAEQQAQETEEPKASQNVVLTSYDTSPTSQVNQETLRRVLEGPNRSKGLSLVSGKPFPFQGVNYGTLWCYPDREQGTHLILEEFLPGATRDTPRRALVRIIPSDSDQAAIQVLLAWAQGRIDHPELWQSQQLEQWGSIDLNYNVRNSGGSSAPMRRPHQLRLTSSEGVEQTHYTFAREDLQVAADGLLTQHYRKVHYVKEGGYLLMTVETGDAADGRCTVTMSRIVDQELRFYRRKCSHREAAQWLMAFCDDTFSPNWREWKDVTKQMMKD